VINFIIVACRISLRLKWYKNYKNRLRLAKVIVKNKMSRFYGSVCSFNVGLTYNYCVMSYLLCSLTRTDSNSKQITKLKRTQTIRRTNDKDAFQNLLNGNRDSYTCG